MSIATLTAPSEVANYVKSEETLLLTSPTAGAPLTLRSRCPATETKVMLFRSHGNGPSWPPHYPIGPKRLKAVEVLLKRAKLQCKPLSPSYADQLILRAATECEPA
jgi:hypothetical protein